MPKTAQRPEPVDADVQACQLDPNDPLLKEPIDENWKDMFFERLCRELARQLQQQEKMPVTTNNLTRLGNIRGLAELNRELERIARQDSNRAARRKKDNVLNRYEAFAALERRLFPQLESPRTPEPSEQTGS